MRIVLGIHLGGSGHPIGTFVVLDGLVGGFAIIGTESSITSDASDGTVTARRWGSSEGATQYGTGLTPPDLTAGDGGDLWAGIQVDGEWLYRRVTIAYPAGTAAAISAQSLTVDDDAASINAAATGANLTFAYSLTAPPGLSISAVGQISGTLTAPFSGTVGVVATDQYGRQVATSFALTAALRAQAAAAGGLGPFSFAENSAIAAQDLAADFTTGGNTLIYAIAGGTLPAGLSLSAAGLLTGTPTTPTAAATYTIRATDEYERTTDTTFSLAVVEVAASAWSITDNQDGTFTVTSAPDALPAPSVTDNGDGTFSIAA